MRLTLRYNSQCLLFQAKQNNGLLIAVVITNNFVFWLLDTCLVSHHYLKFQLDNICESHWGIIHNVYSFRQNTSKNAKTIVEIDQPPPGWGTKWGI